jgi:aarF domain-containing kinase
MLPKTYDVNMISKFYWSKPRIVLARATEIARLGRDFLWGIFTDYRRKKMQENEDLRASQFVELIATLGPAFIKFGQALSIRPDVCSPVYLEQLIKLQDQVPPFSSDVALSIISSELAAKGYAASDVFVRLSDFDKPIAAASLGQVYRAELKGSGQIVAVKVQRPDMYLTVTLDLFIMRSFFHLCRAMPFMGKECQGMVYVVDEWAGKFVDELDYLRELENTERFRNLMLEAGDAVIVPQPFPKLSSERLTVTQWIDGTKLSKIDTSTDQGKDTVRKLTKVLLSSYLVQLLETGFLHADPHPGNFLVTNEGKLCILDYGLMTDVEEENRFLLLEFITNLLAKDYKGTLDGLSEMGFIPPEVVNDPSKRAIVGPLVGAVFEQIAAGGGAFNIDIEEITKDVQGMANEFPMIIPPWFGLVLRSFAALEGLGLSVDKDYSIVQECFPYLSRRMLSDDSMRIRKTLKTFLYGTKGRVDIDRVDALREGYRIFTSTSFQAASGKAFEELQFSTAPPCAAEPTNTPRGKGAVPANPAVAKRSAWAQTALVSSRGGAQGATVPAARATDKSLDPTVSAAAKVLFSPQGNFVQELVLEEAVNIADALSRSIVSSAIASVTRNPVAVGSLLMRNAIVGGTAAMLPPILKPVSNRMRNMRPFFPFSLAVQEIGGVFHLREEDIESLRTLKRLVQMLAGVDPSDPSMQKSSVVVDMADDQGKSASTGLIDAEDLALVQQVLVQFSSQIKPGQWPAKALKIVGPGRGRTADGSNSLRDQMREILPLIRDSVPGATNLAVRFGRRMVGRSLGRLAEQIEGVNHEYLRVEEDEVVDKPDPTATANSIIKPPKNPFSKR